MKSQSLIVRPHKVKDIPLKFAKECAIQIKNFLQTNGISVKDLKGTSAYRINVINQLCGLKKGDNFLVFGHGNPDYIRVGANSPVFTIEDTVNTFEKICYFLSCCTARGIGQQAIKDGALAFIGFKDDFSVPFRYKEEMIEACLSGMKKFFLGQCTIREIEKIMDISFYENENKISKKGDFIYAALFAYNRNSLSVMIH